MKKIFCFIISVFMAFVLTGCYGNVTNTKDGGNGQIFINNGLVIGYTFQDIDTGVWYVGGNGGVCPRYNVDGTLYVTEVK